MTRTPGDRGSLLVNLGRFERVAADDAPATEAAVCLAVVTGEEGLGVTVLLRGQVGSHRGQYGLPGGRVDAGETAAGAALRELEEEVGITADHQDVLVELDPLVTRSGFRMRPFVVWCGGATPRIASPQEIAAVHVVPLHVLGREGAVLHTTVPETGNPTVQVDVGFTTVYAPTGAILHQFRDAALLGRSTRVDHLDSPRFTWR